MNISLRLNAAGVLLTWFAIIMANFDFISTKVAALIAAFAFAVICSGVTAQFKERRKGDL